MEDNQKVIITFLLNEEANVRDIAERMQTVCRHSLVNMSINFEQFNSGLQRYGSVIKISMMKFALKDLLHMILMP
jgi:hypothetical protein